MPKRSHATECMIKGAMYGAPLLGVAGFVTGTVLCLHAGIPLPPLLTFEAGALLGAVLGGLIGLIVAWRISRCILYTLLATAFAISGAMLAGARVGAASLQAFTLMAILVGANWGLVHGQKPPQSMP